MNNRFVSLVLLVILSLIVIGGCTAGLSAYTPVQAGELAVVTRFGGTTGEVFYPGLNWKTPFIEGTIVLTTQPRVYETSDNPGESGADFTDYPVNSQTADGQDVRIKYSVIFHVPVDDESAGNIAKEYRYLESVVERLVKAQSRSIARNHAKLYTAEQLYGSNDPDGIDVFVYQEGVRTALAEKFNQLGFGVVLDDFLVRKIDFDEQYVNTIEQQQIEQEKIKTADFMAQQAKYEADRIAALAEGEAAAKVVNAEADATVRVINAEAEAKQVVIAAEAEATAVETVADAEAYAKEQVGRMLDRYPDTLTLEFIKQFDAVDWGIMPWDSVTPLFPLEIPGSP